MRGNPHSPERTAPRLPSRPGEGPRAVGVFHGVLADLNRSGHVSPQCHCRGRETGARRAGCSRPAAGAALLLPPPAQWAAPGAASQGQGGGTATMRGFINGAVEPFMTRAIGPRSSESFIAPEGVVD